MVERRLFAGVLPFPLRGVETGVYGDARPAADTRPAVRTMVDEGAASLSRSNTSSAMRHQPLHSVGNHKTRLFQRGSEHGLFSGCNGAPPDDMPPTRHTPLQP